VLSAYALTDERVVSISIGLINRTFRVEAANESFILQRLHPVFDASVHEDIAAVTAHLVRKGMPTPELVPTSDGRLCVRAEDGIWRLLTCLEGGVLEELASPQHVAEAGRLVADFHLAVSDLNHEFRFSRAGVHDTAAHLARLGNALANHSGHARYGIVEPMGQQILAQLESPPDWRALPSRVVHGDLKITNILFDARKEHASALIDLDTLARSNLAVELGDAFRSWCNPRGESSDEAHFDAELFGYAIGAYGQRARALLQQEEIASIVSGIETIALELAARFCADALEESYFGWDPKRFESRGEHNEARARSQLLLARSVRAQRGELERQVVQAFGGPAG